MAKKHKKLSKRKQVELLKKQGLSFKEARRIRQENRVNIIDLIIADSDTKTIEKAIKKSTQVQQKKPKKSSYDAYKYRVSQKRMYLDSIGVKSALERGVFSDRKIDSIRLSDIENNTVTREKYPWITELEYAFNWDKEYTFKNGNRLFVAYRDYQGEIDLADQLEFHAKMSVEQLLSRLHEIVNKTETRTGKVGDSGGKAGGFKWTFGSQQLISSFNKEAYDETRKDKYALDQQKLGKDVFIRTKAGRKRKRAQFKGEKVGFQVMKNGERVSYDTVTPRNLLIVANSIMWNVTEADRNYFYTSFKRDLMDEIPEMFKYLP